MAKILKPGTDAPKSGQYREVGPRGGYVSNTEITAVAGKNLPPTSRPGNGFILVDPTKHSK
ncbi:TPA: YjzC family protein [Candidatus Galligastranaerophilus intestinavium]|uniref:YjzC family protein n=1 Tax=Candidatus Galligastranaerophilus intestinavium TaxID=2840836 RepID=A0A9D1FI63_9BACT|nr:YjzC family protein [Candidatus Galligastranaerophilus intestinavium]